MKVYDKEVEIAQQSTITQLTRSLQLPDKGVAIAVNNKMTPKTEWDNYALQENDHIVIIKAACGG